MYTEQSVKLKSDFYARYGETTGELYFEKTGLPCTILDGGRDKMMFSFECGVRAYARAYGDVLRVIDDRSNVCDVHFTEHGKGAQILYRMDVPDIKGMKETALYTINKLLWKMNRTGREEGIYPDWAICDRYAPKGWCAVKQNDEIKSVPLPVADCNTILVQIRKNGFMCSGEDRKYFEEGERRRISAAASSLKECRTDVFFDMVSESQRSIERVLMPIKEAVCAVECAENADGVEAVRITDRGIIAFCKKSMTDSAVHFIHMACEKNLGYGVRISVVK